MIHVSPSLDPPVCPSSTKMLPTPLIIVPNSIALRQPHGGGSGSQKFSVRWGAAPCDGACLSDPREIRPSTISVMTANLVVLYNDWCVIREILRSSLILRVPSIKVTQGQWNRRHGSIGHLTLPVGVAQQHYGPISYRFSDKKRKILPSPRI